MSHTAKTSGAAALLAVVVGLGPAAAPAQTGRSVDSADLAFEQGRWETAIAGYRERVAERPDDRLGRLRIAQAERELGRYESALETLEQARAAEAPEAMIELERARNLLALGRRDDALDALEAADRLESRARSLLEASPDFDPVRADPRFGRVLRSVTERVSPCLGVPEASQLDFWVGRWEVRTPDGMLIGYDTVTKDDGGCAVVERWDRISGSGGTSLSFFVPSLGEWRHVFAGSGGALVELTGGLRDGGEMHMEGTLEYVRPEAVVALRATWTPMADGSVRQRMERLDTESQDWIAWFDGVFRPIDR